MPTGNRPRSGHKAFAFTALDAEPGNAPFSRRTAILLRVPREPPSVMSLDDRIATFDLLRPLDPDPARPQTNEPVSVHVIDDDETVLFGTGFDSGAATLIDELEAYGGPDVIVCEHGDPDHYQALPTLLEAFPDATVAIPAPDVDALDDVGVEADVELEHDEVRWNVRTILIPGHTPGNMSFLHEDSGTLVVGDTFVHKNSFTAEPYDWSGDFAFIKSVLNDDTAEMYETTPILADYDFDCALLTHGLNVFEGAYGEFEKLLDDLDDLA